MMPTREYIRKLPPGPVMNALIAERVMDWSECSILSCHADQPSLGFPPDAPSERKTIGGYAYWAVNGAVPVPDYSGPDAATLDLLAVLHRRGLWVELHLPPPDDGDGKPEASLYRDFWVTDRPDWLATGDTLPHALGRVALLHSLEEE
jgi:hypothetical protein